eukprot:scaffold27254_cov70-Phaeocystis_antarctica.AAC.1
MPHASPEAARPSEAIGEGVEEDSESPTPMARGRLLAAYPATAHPVDRTKLKRASGLTGRLSVQQREGQRGERVAANQLGASVTGARTTAAIPPTEKIKKLIGTMDLSNPNPNPNPNLHPNPNPNPNPNLNPNPNPNLNQASWTCAR